MTRDPRYLPALRFHWLTSCYDPLVRLTTRERRFKRELIEQMGAAPGQRVLDVGCGSATLALALKREQPLALITGLDADPRILKIAAAKRDHAGLAIDLRHGYADALPFADASFERVVASLFFHHLGSDTKGRALAEIRRVLVPGGELHIADWTGPTNAVMRALFLVVQLLDGFDTTSDHVSGRFVALLGEAGFLDVRERRRLDTPVGTLGLFSCSVERAGLE